jgi:hypothetical protein
MFSLYDDLLIAHPSFTLLQQALRDLERCLAKEGLSITPDKTQFCPLFRYLGHTIVDNAVKPPKLKLDIKEVMTLNELQTLLGNINWILPFLKIPSDSLKPVFELLKGDLQLNSFKKLTPKTQQAIQLIETTLQHSFINRIDPSQALQLITWGTPTTPTGAIIQWPNKMIDMLFTHNTLPKTVSPYIQEIINLIMRGRQRCKQLSDNDPSLIVTPFTNIKMDHLYKQNYLWQIELVITQDNLIITIPKTLP